MHHLHGSELAGKTARLSRLGIPLFASTGAAGNRYSSLPNCPVKWVVTWPWGFRLPEWRGVPFAPRAPEGLGDSRVARQLPEDPDHVRGKAHSLWMDIAVGGELAFS